MGTHPYAKHYVFGAALALGGVAAGFFASGMKTAAPLLVVVTGASLVLCSRLYENWVRELEKRIAVLEAMRRSADNQRKGMAELYMAFAAMLAENEDRRLPAGHRQFKRIQRFAVDTALDMGLDEDTVEALRTAALLHDIGRVCVPAHIWTKTEPLDEDEWRLVRNHVNHAETMLSGVPFPWPVAPIIRAHHERWDGQGYPMKLRGEQIPMGARILAVADAYEALHSERPHRPARDWKQALDILWADAGKRFDPDVVKAFGRVIAKGQYTDLDVHPSRAGVARLPRQPAPKPA
jgi:HD-GYP domain-containing protein (c-di-GMP phosphodiesterase class II)